MITLADDGLDVLVERVVAEIGAVLDEEFETANRAEAHHRRRRHGENERVLDGGKLFVQLGGDSGPAEIRLLAILKRVETEENNARIRRDTEAADAQARERDGVAHPELDLLVTHDQRHGAVLDLEELLGTAGVRLAGMRVARTERPVPQLGDVRRLGAGDEHGLPAELAPPQHRGGTGASDLQPGRAVHIHQRGQPDAERVADQKQRRDARVGRALLDADQHPAADTRPFGQLVQRPAPAVPSLPDPAADGPGDAVRPGPRLQF